MKKAILFRMGGMGDILICTIVPKQLRKMGYDVVDACFGSPSCNVKELLKGVNPFDNVFEYTRSFTGVDCYKTPEGDDASIELLKQGYDLVVDYKYSIELNSHYKDLANAPGREWFVSQNSNFQNWADVMLSWAGVDPTTVSDEEKIPLYEATPDELDWAAKVAGASATSKEIIISIQTNASSLVRTFYYPLRLPDAIKMAYPGKPFTFLLFDGVNWLKIKDDKRFPILFPEGLDKIRYSAALLGVSDLFIGADSGFSHIAETLHRKSITIYTTVPSWTRMKYYKYSTAIEPIGHEFNGVKCHPCFVLDRWCPRIREKALAERTEREVKLAECVIANRNPVEVAEEFGTTPQGILMEAEMAAKRIEALFERQSPCSETITPERIVDKVRSILG
jgi:hypothetical protein